MWIDLPLAPDRAYSIPYGAWTQSGDTMSMGMVDGVVKGAALSHGERSRLRGGYVKLLRRKSHTLLRIVGVKVKLPLLEFRLS